MSKEAFIYLWYDAPNDMYYLGKHKGSPDDTYTHSSTIWESFTKDNIPEGVTRRILAYGTDEEMCILEHELLVEAKNGGDWDRYYNVGVGDPRYVDISGKDHPAYKHGMCRDMRSYNNEMQGKPKEKYGGKSYRQVYYGKKKDHMDEITIHAKRERKIANRIEKLIILLENEEKRFGLFDKETGMHLAYEVECIMDYIVEHNLNPEILLSYDLFDKY